MQDLLEVYATSSNISNSSIANHDNCLWIKAGIARSRVSLGVMIIVAGRNYFNIMCCCSCGWLCRSVMWTQMKMGLKDSWDALPRNVRCCRCIRLAMQMQAAAHAIKNRIIFGTSTSLIHSYTEEQTESGRTERRWNRVGIQQEVRKEKSLQRFICIKLEECTFKLVFIVHACCPGNRFKEKL